MSVPKPLILGEDLDIPALNRALDQTKASVFLGKNASFFGSLLCSLNFYWTSDIKTAAVTPDILMWNPYWFLKLNLSQRKTVLMHELWHPALLHSIRRGDRDHELWNIACDHRINNNLLDDGYDFKGLDPCLDRQYKTMVEEDIYDHLDSLPKLIVNRGSWGPLDPTGDMIDDPDASQDPTVAQTNAVGKVVQAKQVAELSGETVDLSGVVETLLKQFLAPVVPWEIHLARWMQDLANRKRSFRRPNRRYPGLYLPAVIESRGALEHLAYFLDVSGSVSDAEVLRFNSEVKYVKEKFKPKKMTLIQFDTKITDVVVFEEKDKFEKLVIIGRGGTDFTPVRQWIIDNTPTAAIVFSDMHCAPMEPLTVNIPILWVAINNREATVPFGKIIYIKG
jgi:predicted metal-dependent peptidase